MRKAAVKIPRRLTQALLLIWLVSAPKTSLAQTEAELQAARDKFESALALQTGGDWAGALSLLKQVARVRSTPHVRFNIALCEEHLGQLVSALGDYELAAADARRSETEGAAEVARQAEQRLKALAARIPKLTIKRGEGSEAATVTLDGVALGDAVIGTALNVDPGPHRITASAPGFVELKRTVRLDERQEREVMLTLVPEPERPADPPPPPDRTASYAPVYVSAAVGVAGFAAAGVFYGLSQRTRRELDARCPDRRCDPSDRPLYVEGKRYTTLTNVGLAAGALGAAASLFFSLSAAEDSPRQGLAPGAPGSAAGVSYVARF